MYVCALKFFGTDPQIIYNAELKGYLTVLHA